MSAETITRRRAALFAGWLGVVGTLMQLAALLIVLFADDYRRAFWIEFLGALAGSWAWRIYKAARWT